MDSANKNVQNEPCNLLVCGQTRRSKIKSALELWNGRLDVHYSGSEEHIFRLLKDESPSVLVIDFDDASIDPIKILEFTNNSEKEMLSIGVTESPLLDQIVRASKLGVRTVVDVKSNTHQLQKELDRAYEHWQDRVRGQELFTSQKSKHDFSQIIGQSPQMQQIFALISKVIKRKWVTVLIRGETGTGKELIARSIHFNTCPSEQPFIEINCSALPESLLESELFGYEKGAFTDAKISKAGLFELAHNGTLFLDEIGEITPKVQIKLLKALEEKNIRRLGGTKDININTRIITATNRNLQEAIKEGEFRTDLFYRLNVFHIDIPPLRDRGNDVILLANHFLKHFAKEYDSPAESFSADAELLLKQYQWPGNVRELRHTIERITLLSDDREISREDLEQTIDSETPIVMSERHDDKEFHMIIPPHGVTLEEAERELVKQTLKRNAWNKRRACKILKISRPRLDRKIQLYNLTPEEE